MNGFPIIRAGAALMAITLAVALLWFADGSARDVRHDTLAPTLLSITFVSMMVVLALSSVSDRLHFGLQMFAVYFAIYLLLPGYHHATTNVFPFYAMAYSWRVIRESALIITWFSAMTMVGYVAAHVHAGGGPQLSLRGKPRRVRANLILATGLLLVAMAAAAVYLSSVGIAGAFSSRAETVATSGDTTAGGLFRSLPRVITFISLLYSIVMLRFSSVPLLGRIYLAFNIPIFLVVNWPPGLARFVLFGYILLILVLFGNMRSIVARIGLTAGFVVGALGLMPLVEMFTRGKGSADSLGYGSLLSRYFETADFDGLQSVNNAVIYVNEQGLTNGRQLLSVLFFFVPRTIWPGKGEPTGVITAEAANFTFLNISQPLPSEFYVDFGLTGVLIGGLLVGYGLCRTDLWINRNWTTGPASRLVAGLLVAYSIIIYRGALLGIIATITTLVAGGLLIVRYGMTPYEKKLRTKVALRRALLAKAA